MEDGRPTCAYAGGSSGGSGNGGRDDDGVAMGSGKRDEEDPRVCMRVHVRGSLSVATGGGRRYNSSK